MNLKKNGFQSLHTDFLYKLHTTRVFHLTSRHSQLNLVKKKKKQGKKMCRVRLEINRTCATFAWNYEAQRRRYCIRCMTRQADCKPRRGHRLTGEWISELLLPTVVKQSGLSDLWVFGCCWGFFFSFFFHGWALSLRLHYGADPRSR